MFGYVRPPALPREEQERFRRMYCGLCGTLAERYGPSARWILNYDFTFLAILLSDGGESGRTRRCPPHPLRGRSCLASSPALELAADESVILSWRKLRDNVEDSALWRGLPDRAACAALRSACETAAAFRPDFHKTVCRQLAALRALEAENCASLDRPADTFALLLRAAAGETEGTRRRVLEEMLYHLGRWIYLVDAADDLKQDAKSGNYNPVALRFDLRDGVWTQQARREFALTLDHSVRAIAAAYELWDFGVWSPVLEATIYGGLFQTGKAVLDGTFRRRAFPRFGGARQNMEADAGNRREGAGERAGDSGEDVRETESGREQKEGASNE